MGLTLIEAPEYQGRLEHLAFIKIFAECELFRWLPFLNNAGGGPIDLVNSYGNSNFLVLALAISQRACCGICGDLSL